MTRLAIEALRLIDKKMIKVFVKEQENRLEIPIGARKSPKYAKKELK